MAKQVTEWGHFVADMATQRDVFDYIEMFCNPKRRHGYTNRLSPVEFEK